MSATQEADELKAKLNRISDLWVRIMNDLSDTRPPTTASVMNIIGEGIPLYFAPEYFEDEARGVVQLLEVFTV